MRNLISLFLVLCSTSVFAATGSGNISNVLNLGGVSKETNLTINEPNSQGYFTLYGGNSAPTAGNYIPLYKDGTAYQVGSGKTFKVIKICYFNSTGAVGFQLVAATAPIANDAATITGGVYMNGVASLYPMRSEAANVYTCFGTTYSIAQNLYVGLQQNTGTPHSVLVVGKEI